ncbi:T6SS immunity protein Tli4 family protein [Cupriavidus taiwanensis]|uniref:T6SS immunity protein Tli4 family protein n=1 Tax=Cupriavidus taiwanensis TaxID=164546 RepID=UPI000E1733B1|nr:T6SS immunity protein Tli4 family protein [Cupriavidus taiwanensis]SOZ24725.1 exported hypothetical protein [Cupriavidus taiwanensis]SPA29679.1 exported hypothetical protein [Cupriavidus taiwanensis]
MMHRIFPTAMAACIATVIASTGHAKTPRNILMDKSGWKTHCFGRYLVDLPSQAKISAAYRHGLPARRNIPAVLERLPWVGSCQIRFLIHQDGERNVGAIPAEEYATAATGNGQRVYVFAWESQGKNKSLSEQNVSAGLRVLEQPVDSPQTPYQPAFQSDDEALQLWDAIINSIRLRPGAV